MLFNSIDFAFFLTLVLVGHYFCIPRRAWGGRKTFLIVVSYLFYMSWNPAFLLLLLTSTLVDYSLGLAIEQAPKSRRLAYVWVSVVVNLGILAFFKYGNFVGGNVVWILHALGWNLRVPTLDITLPVAISFYTFESLSYSIDVYRGMPACRSIRDFALFLSFFPHLVAGPIVRPRFFLSQLGTAPVVSGPQIEMAIARIAQGLVKKVLLADVLGAYVDPVFATHGGATAPGTLLAIYAYTFQIYFDFSGYTDMALGISQLFGLRLPRNFDRPYLAASPREFWQRWHISLSTWLRDYLYIPLGGNRVSVARTYANVMVTMLLGGLWHGAAWHFVAWGAFHGAWLAVHRWVAAARGRGSFRFPLWLRRLVSFHLVCLGWVLFRASTLADAGRVLAALGGSWHLSFDGEVIQTLALVGLAVILHMIGTAERAREMFVKLPGLVQGATYGAVAVLIFLIAPATERFIYFQF